MHESLPGEVAEISEAEAAARASITLPDIETAGDDIPFGFWQQRKRSAYCASSSARPAAAAAASAASAASA